MSIDRFLVDTSDADLDDLRKRIDETRWTRSARRADWEYGVPEPYLRGLAEYWKRDFDWRKQEDYINSFSNFRAQIEGLGIHFITIPARGPNPLPLLLLHGWPSTFHEMLRLGNLLANPDQSGDDPRYAFTVVIPSIPGHGYSDHQPPGFADRDVARTFVQLMNQLGYERFGVHAYDLGASIAGYMCIDFPASIVGYHTTSPGSPGPYLGAGAQPLTQSETEFLEEMEKWYADEGGYSHLLGTRPDTVGYALNDSPVGLAAWIIEKWHAWTAPPSGNLDDHFSKDDLLTNVTIYWLRKNIASANRYYREKVERPGIDDVVSVPYGVAKIATQHHEKPPRQLVERLFPDIRSWIDLPRGGHFVALEDPESLATAIRGFFHGIHESQGAG